MGADLSHTHLVPEIELGDNFIHKDFKSLSEEVCRDKGVVSEVVDKLLTLPWNSKDEISFISPPAILSNSTKDIMDDEIRVYNTGEF